MVVAIIAFLVSGVALVAAGFFLFRHWKEIRLLDPLSIKEERERQKREQLLHRRFSRLNANKLQPLRRFASHLKQSTARFYRRTEERLQSFEAVYKNIKHPFASLAPTTRERINTLLHEARTLLRDLKWAEAERRYLEALSLDQRQAEAYKGLGQIYLKQHLYPQAKETFEFLLKIKQADDATFAGLADIAEAQADDKRAEEMRLKAVEFNSRQAHRHVQLAQFYLARHEPNKAWPSAKRASDLEPGSAKYLEVSLEIAILLGDRKEARHRYDRLRLLSEDRNKMQVWREKVEALEKEKK